MIMCIVVVLLPLQPLLSMPLSLFMIMYIVIVLLPLEPLLSRLLSLFMVIYVVFVLLTLEPPLSMLLSLFVLVLLPLEPLLSRLLSLFMIVYVVLVLLPLEPPLSRLWSVPHFSRAQCLGRNRVRLACGRSRVQSSGSFVEIGHEIISTVFLFLPPVNSVNMLNERLDMTIVVNWDVNKSNKQTYNVPHIAI